MVGQLVHRKNRRGTHRGAQSGDSQKQIDIKGPLILAVVVAVVVFTGNWSLEGLGYFEITLLFCLLFACILPSIQWYRRGMLWLPLGEAFVLLHILYYVLPCLTGQSDWFVFSRDMRVQAIFGVGVFLATFFFVYRMIVNGALLRFSKENILRREMNTNLMWLMFGFWILWSILYECQMLPQLGSAANIYHSVITATGCLSLVYLYYQIGKRKLSGNSRFFAFVGLAVGLAFNFASGYLNGPVEWLGAAILAFTLGRKKVPVLSVVACIVLLCFLQLGKVGYRAAYWNDEGVATHQDALLTERYATWFRSSWENLVNTDKHADKPQGVLERVGLMPILTRAMAITPDSQPFLNGETYFLTPQMLVPRIFWAQKPRGSLPTETLGIYLGIQNEQNAISTSISVGPITEGWINFGWLGVIGAGAFFGVLFGYPAKLSRVLVPNQVGWLISSIFLIYSLDLEHLIAEVVSSLLTALITGVAVLIVISSPKSILQQGQIWRNIFKPSPSKELH